MARETITVIYRGEVGYIHLDTDITGPITAKEARDITAKELTFVMRGIDKLKAAGIEAWAAEVLA